MCTMYWLSYLGGFVVKSHGRHNWFEAFELLIPHVGSVLFQNGLGPCLNGAFVARPGLGRRRGRWLSRVCPAHGAGRLQPVGVGHPDLGRVVVIVGLHLGRRGSESAKSSFKTGRCDYMVCDRTQFWWKKVISFPCPCCSTASLRTYVLHFFQFWLGL